MAVYKLGDVCSYIEGYTNPSINNKDFFGGNKINWMRVKDLKNGSSINKTELTLSNEGFNLIKNKNQIFKKGTIVWSKSGTVGNVGLLNINVCANRGILNILPKEKIHKKYLYYFLLKNKNKFQNLSTGAVLKHFYGPNLMNFKINLPSIKIQKQIIDIIEPFENLIKIMKKIILIIENYSKNIQIINNEKIKVNKIIYDYSNGFAYKKEHIDDYGKYKIFTIKNIQNKDKFNKSNHFKNNKLNIGALITGLSGTIGSVDIIDEKNWVGNQRTLQLKTKYFLEIKSTIEINKIKLLKKAKGAAQKNISYSDILNLKVFIKKFNQEISNFYLTIKKNIQKIKKIKFLMINLLIK